MAMMTRNHDEELCHQANNKRRKVIERLKDMVECLQECDRYGKVGEDEAYPPDWAVPLITYPLTKERRGSYDKDIMKTPPWEKDRKSVQVIGGLVVQGCQCSMRNGLQADCKMHGCNGHELCLTKPYPLCPNGGHANQLVTPEEAARIMANVPGPEPTEAGECIPGRACRPQCMPCSASLSDICKYIPEWTEMPGQSGPRKGSLYDPEKAGVRSMSGAGKAAYKTAMEAGKPGTNWWCCVARGYGGH
uniref:Src kinase-associated phosphoprotein 2 n=1 Tax=Lygus hesperus TaxID=30085 RepID=A0A0A9XNF6_LYGHE